MQRDVLTPGSGKGTTHARAVEDLLSQTPEHVPDTSVTIIRRSRGLFDLNLPSLWAYRELLYFLTWRDVKVRYKQTALGAAWAAVIDLDRAVGNP